MSSENLPQTDKVYQFLQSIPSSSRVTLRYRLPDISPEGSRTLTPHLSDALGPIDHLSPSEVTITTRKGPVTIALEAIQLSKEVP